MLTYTQVPCSPYLQKGEPEPVDKKIKNKVTRFGIYLGNTFFKVEGVVSGWESFPQGRNLPPL